MSFTVVVSMNGERVAKYAPFKTRSEAAEHAAVHGGEIVEDSTLDGPLLHWLKSGGIWSVSAPASNAPESVSEIDQLKEQLAQMQEALNSFNSLGG